MDHDKIKEIINLSIYNEISEEEKLLLNEHLSHCDECRAEYEEVKKLDKLLVNLKSSEFDLQLLNEARQELRNAINIERSKKFFWGSIIEKLSRLFTPNYKLVFGSIALILIGLGIGYLLFNTNKTGTYSEFINASQIDPFERDNIKIKNLRFIDPDASDGEISFTFDAVKPVKMKGKMNDPMIQKVLAHSLLNEQNDGVRIRTLNAISVQTENKTFFNSKVKSSLITALKYDENPGVRREALLVLRKLPVDDEIIDAFLYVLKHDKNSGLRVEAINSLGETKIGEKNVSPEMLELLRQKSKNDENQYVRVRAKSILQEVVQQ
jgi:hypothetical protein